MYHLPTLVLFSYGVAALAGGPFGAKGKDHCLCDAEAQGFSDDFDLISEQRPGWQAVAKAKWAPDFQLISESLIWLKQGELNTPAANSMEDYLEKYVYSLPPTDSTSDKIFLLEHSCQIITVYRQFNIGTTPIRGTLIFFIDLAKRQVKKMYWEFNNAAARYAICESGSPACPRTINFTIGDSEPAYETANCKGLKLIS